MKDQLVAKENISSHTLLLWMKALTHLTLPSCQFICGINSHLCVTKFLGLHPTHGTTTPKDLYQKVSKCLNVTGLPWHKLAGLTEHPRYVGTEVDF